MPTTKTTKPVTVQAAEALRRAKRIFAKRPNHNTALALQKAQRKHSAARVDAIRVVP